MDEQELNSLLICEIENQHIDYRLGNWNNQVAWVAFAWSRWIRKKCTTF